MAQDLGIEVHESDINIIHHLPSSSAQKHVIAKLIDRHLRNRILYAKRDALNNTDCAFERVYVHEDLTARVVLLLSISEHRRVNFRSYLRQKGSREKMVVENPDDLLWVGIDLNAGKIVQFGYQDI